MKCVPVREWSCTQKDSPISPSNGLAERAVQTLKSGLKKLTGPLETRLTQFLFGYRITPQTTTGLSPAELMFIRPLRSRLDLVYSDVSTRVLKHQMQQEDSRKYPARSFSANAEVLCRDFSTRKIRWILAVVQSKTDPVSYKVQLPDGSIVRRHIDQLLPRVSKSHLDFFDNIPLVPSETPHVTVPLSPRRLN